MTTAIYIDLDNVCNTNDIKNIYSKLETLEKFSIHKYACGNFINDEIRSYLINMGFDVSINPDTKKNKTDIKIMLKMSKIIYRKSKIKRIILIASDRDYDEILNEAIGENIEFKILGYEKSTSERIKNMGSVFTSIEKFLGSKRKKTPKRIIKPTTADIVKKTSPKRVIRKTSPKIPNFDERDKECLKTLQIIFDEKNPIYISKLKSKIKELNNELAFDYSRDEWYQFDKYIENKFSNKFKIKRTVHLKPDCPKVLVLRKN